MKLPRYAITASFFCFSLHATVTISALIPSVPSPQPIGTPVTFNVSATDSHSGPLTFQFSAAYEGAAFKTVRNYNVGVLTAGVWNAQPFQWDPITPEGLHRIRVVAKDFKTGETATQTIGFALTSLVTNGVFTVVPTQNPLVALAAIPPCPTGSGVRAYFTQQGTTATVNTSFVACNGTVSSNIYLGGMYASTTYTAGYQILTGTTLTTGPGTATFTSGPLPANVFFPPQTLIVPPTTGYDQADSVLLHTYNNIGVTMNTYVPTATDLAGTPIWYFNRGTDATAFITRPLPGGYFLFLESGLVWSTGQVGTNQLMRQVDLEGTVLQETNVGLLQQQLLALGATDLQSCGNAPKPVPVGFGCLAALDHDAIRLPNGDFAFLGSVEKIYPPGTQGDTTGLNVDILGNAIIVVNPDLNAVWYFDAFQHASGAPQFNIKRPAILGETCTQGEGGCPSLFLAGSPGVTPLANDWLHCNSIQYRSLDGDIILSSRHQDWVVKVDYNNGKGTGNVLWRMGHGGDYKFNNINDDPYPWFSHQHDAGFETNGVFTVFDNGNTRIAKNGGNSRGIALNVDEAAFTVTPVLSQDLGVYGFALGSAQLLSNGNYHFQPGVVAPTNFDYSIELLPTPQTTSGTQVYNLESSTSSYRSFRMPDLYTPPTT